MIRAFTRTTLRTSGIAALAAASILLAACGGGGHARGMFSGYVMGKTEGEIIEKVGPPASIDRANPEFPILVYKAKTFDPDNSNRTDPETLVYMAKDKGGKVVASEVNFRG